MLAWQIGLNWFNAYIKVPYPFIVRNCFSFLVSLLVDYYLYSSPMLSQVLRDRLRILSLRLPDTEV